MIKQALEFLYQAGRASVADAQSRSTLSEISDSLYADREGNLAIELNREIARRAREPNDVERRDTAHDVPSFAALVTGHKTESAEVFVAEERAVAVLAMEGWRKHTVILPLERSESWNFWGNSAARSATDVADLVAAHIDDVTGDGVSGAQLLECLSGLDWISEESTRSQHTITGTKITHKSDDRVAELPGVFTVAVPVYTCEDRKYPLKIRLTARRVECQRVIVFTPIGTDAVERIARGLLLEDIRKGIEGVPVHAGVPHLGLEP